MCSNSLCFAANRSDCSERKSVLRCPAEYPRPQVLSLKKELLEKSRLDKLCRWIACQKTHIKDLTVRNRDIGPRNLGSGVSVLLSRRSNCILKGSLQSKSCTTPWSLLSEGRIISAWLLTRYCKGFCKLSNWSGMTGQNFSTNSPQLPLETWVPAVLFWLDKNTLMSPSSSMPKVSAFLVAKMQNWSKADFNASVVSQSDRTPDEIL